MTNIHTILKTVLLLVSMVMFLAAAHMAEAKVQEKVEIIVLKESVRIGTLVTNDMLTTKMVPINAARNALKNADDIIGKESKRNIREGLALRESFLMEPLDVQRGQMVVVNYIRPGISLTTEGKSLMAGRKGDWIYVVNSSSNKRVQAFIEQDGTISVR